MANQGAIATLLAVHEVACPKRWSQANARHARIEGVRGAIVLLLVEGSVVTVVKRLLRG